MRCDPGALARDTSDEPRDGWRLASRHESITDRRASIYLASAGSPATIEVQSVPPKYTFRTRSGAREGAAQRVSVLSRHKGG